VLSSLLLLNLYHVADLIDHAADCRSILKLYGLADTAEAESVESPDVLGLTSDGTLGLSDFDSLLVSHFLLQNLINGKTALCGYLLRGLHGSQRVDG